MLKETIDKIRKEIIGNKTCVSINELKDIEGIFIVNVIIGTYKLIDLAI